MQLLMIILIIFSSIVTIIFGVWHLFVPKIWNWYSYIDPKATELIIAVRAINVFFSLCLILTGIANLIFISQKPLQKISLIVMFAFSTILWGTRLIFQIIYPQGSQNPFVQYSMLCIFSLVFVCFALSLFVAIRQIL